MQEGAQRKRNAVALAREQLAKARAPYDTAAAELLDLMAKGAPKDQEHAARLRMWRSHPPVVAAQRALREAEEKRRLTEAGGPAVHAAPRLPAPSRRRLRTAPATTEQETYR